MSIYSSKSPFQNPAPEVPVRYSPHIINDELDIRTNLYSLLPSWRPESTAATGIGTPSSIHIQSIDSGITNKLFKVSNTGVDTCPVIIRIFGGRDVFTPEERATENLIFAKLAADGIAPRLVCVFANGRVEEFKNARCLELPEMTSRRVIIGVAQAMARMHKFDPGNLVACRDDVSVWGVTGTWAKTSLEMFERGDFREQCSVDVVEMVRELEALKEDLEKQEGGSPTVFAHNDLLRGNILISEDGLEEISFVDFEYGSLNYRGFDIGNFFCEAMGGTDDGHVRSELYPCLEMRRLFCRVYLEEGRGKEVEECEVEELVSEGERYGKLVHMYWGFWALVQSGGSEVEFPYLYFAEQRFGEYVKCKDGE